MRTNITRRWLNPQTSRNNGWVKTYVRSSAHNVDASVTLADCSRQISLDFDVYPYDKSSGQAGLKKLDLLIETLVNYREKYVAHCDNHAKLAREHAEKTANLSDSEKDCMRVRFFGE